MEPSCWVDVDMEEGQYGDQCTMRWMGMLGMASTIEPSLNASLLP